MIEPKLIPKRQARLGFRQGKSCSRKILWLTLYIQDGYETQKNTGVVIVDLSDAYDTVKIKILPQKLSTMMYDRYYIQILVEMLSNQWFQILLNSDKSRWSTQKNSLPRGSVLAPVFLIVISKTSLALTILRDVFRYKYYQDEN